MKKILKCALVLALALAVLSASALAAESTITFRGESAGFSFGPGSDYTATDLFGNFKDVMPGDVLTEEITFTNRSSDSDYVTLYMRAVAHDENENPLTYDEAFENEDGKDQTNVAGQRDETVASMSEFLAQLSMKVWNGNELIYVASPDEPDGLAENVKLGSFRRGETATLTVELTVPEELGNEYANRVGEVDWVFHVDGLDDPKKPSKTGDDGMTLLWLGMACAATAAVVVIVRRKRA